MKKAVDYGYRALEALMVLLLAGMVLLVMANAVARYSFNSTISVADELSRFMFIWLTFIGAAVAHRQFLHLSMQLLVSAMPERSWKLFMVITDVLVLICCLLMVWGGVLVWGVNATIVSPVMQLPMVYVHGVATFSAVLMSFSTINRIYRVMTGAVTEVELKIFADKIEDAEQAALKGGLE